MKEVIFLGSGPSTGIPVVGCSCKVCLSPSVYNKRLRPSILIKLANKNILVDVGPDIRHQSLKYGINKIDYLIITHAHYDHIGGIDDMRIFNRIQKKSIKTFLSLSSYEEIKRRYDYIFQPNKKGHSQSASFNFKILKDDVGEFKVSNERIKYFSYFQVLKSVIGIRLKKFAYVTDIKKYDKSIFKFLKNLDVLVISCLRIQKSAVHLNVDQAIEFAKKVNAKKTYFTHMGHEISHAYLENNLPQNMFPAYDGLVINLENL
ncbi:MAG: hypothetical protein A3F40_02325 [Chlamydiae bacterium RIFCSPHIGHO2_12_FULL_27_8]|nr:MAG: hypothetical protein A3F40_02325 [Chlamydiae bacterium RIFCSPHIGHO2_12_FULL_27_8]